MVTSFSRQIMYSFFLISMIILLLPTQGWTEVYLKGTVLSVDQEKGEIVIQPVEFFTEDENATHNAEMVGSIVVRLPPMQKMWRKHLKHEKRRKHRKRWFQCPTPGQQIRLRGDFDAESNLFLARDMRGCGWRGGPDPTGIRGRLGKGCDKEGPCRKPFGARRPPARHGFPFPPQELDNDAERELGNAGN